MPTFTKEKTEIFIIKSVSVLKISLNSTFFALNLYDLFLAQSFNIYSFCSRVFYLCVHRQGSTKNKNYFSANLPPSQTAQCEMFPDWGKFENLEKDLIIHLNKAINLFSQTILLWNNFKTSSFFFVSKKHYTPIKCGKDKNFIKGSKRKPFSTQQYISMSFSHLFLHLLE